MMEVYQKQRAHYPILMTKDVFPLQMGPATNMQDPIWILASIYGNSDDATP